MRNHEHYVIGVDFGTDSVRVLIVDPANGSEISSDVQFYPRWVKGLYCDALKNQFRQHPLDYVETLKTSVKNALAKLPAGAAEKIRGMSIDTTGSTPCAVDKKGTPLALTPGFEENPNAMFVLWKDHTAVEEAEQINALAKTWGGEDFTKYSGGIYSAEWYWSKILHILREDAGIRPAAYSWVEHCDWVPALLTGTTNPLTMKRSRTAAGHKAMWHASWDGLPSEAFLMKLDPLLTGLRDRLYTASFTTDVVVGNLTAEWAQEFGLTEDVIVGAGSFDAHVGAVGAGVGPNTLVKVMGTSTCDMLITPNSATGEKLVKGICGQVDGSIIPGMLGMEAGQSCVGDLYAWFKDLLLWPLEKVTAENTTVDPSTRQKLLTEISEQMIPALAEEAGKMGVSESGIVALDWLNGRRTPDANQMLKGAIAGLNLGSDPAQIFRALVEATAFGARKIVDRFISAGVKIEDVIAIGGVAAKAPFVMQVHADVLNMKIKVAKSENTCALGAAMCAATAAGIYATIGEAQQNMGSGFASEYHPDPENARKYAGLYERYSRLGNFIERELT